MQHETELDPMDLPFDLEADIGIIKEASLECPGVYYIAASRGPFRVADEYYVVDDDTSIIPDVEWGLFRRRHGTWHHCRDRRTGRDGYISGIFVF